MRINFLHIIWQIIFIAINFSLHSQVFNNADSPQSEIEFLSEQEEWIEIGGDIKVMMTEDEDGYIWFSSPRGLGRYDGADFKYFSHALDNPHGITNGQIITIEPDIRNERVLLGYQTLGFHILNLDTENILKFTSIPNDTSSLSNDFITTIYVDRQERIWIITFDGILHLFNELEGTFFRFPVPIPDKYSESFRTRQGHMIQDIHWDHIFWIASRFGIFKFDISTNSYTHYDIDHFVYPYAYQFSSPIYQDSSGLIWFGHFRNEGVKVFDPKKESWIHQIDTKGYSSFIVDIKPYGDSTIIATVRGSHLLYINKFNPDDFVIKKLTQRHLGANSLVIDKENRLHLMSNKGTIAQLQSQQKPIKHASIIYKGAHYPIFEVAYNSKNFSYYFGRRWANGLLVTDTLLNPISHHALLNSNRKEDPSKQILAMYLDTSEQFLWLGTNRGISKFDIASNTFIDDSIIKSTAWNRTSFTTISASPKRLSFIAKDKMVCYDKSTSTFEIHCFADDKPAYVPTKAGHFNQVLVLGTLNGMHLIDPVKKTEIDYTIPEKYDQIKHQIYISSLFIEADTIWLGSYGDGLFKLIHQGNMAFNVERFYNPISPYSNSIQAIFSKGDKLWLIGPHGYQLYDRSTKKALIYNRADGVELSWRRALFKNGHRDIIINPSDNSFYYFDQKDINPKDVHPYLVNFTANGEKQILSKNTTEYITLDYSQRDISFEFGARNFSTQNINYYRYKLSGYQKDWQFNNDRNFISFTNLPAGKYTFEYDARSVHSYWNDVPQKIHFQINPHPLATRWFKIIWVILGLLFLWSILKFIESKKSKEQVLLRLQKERAEAELKALRAQMNPHFLFNTLNSINWYIIQNNPLDASKFLTKFSKLMRMILDNSKMERISLQKELDTLRLYVEIEAVRFEHKFDFRFIIDPKINQDKYLLPPLLFQPFFENAIWHGLLTKKGPGIVTLQIIKRDKYLECNIEDDGIGRKASGRLRTDSSSRKSRGIEITSQRIQNFNGLTEKPIQIIDLMDAEGKDCGTSVAFKLPREK